jgi:hypothetical protein
MHVFRKCSLGEVFLVLTQLNLDLFNLAFPQKSPCNKFYRNKQTLCDDVRVLPSRIDLEESKKVAN